MAGFWDKLRGKAGSGGDGRADPMAELLAGYPPNRPRHPGDPAGLSQAERGANLAQMLEECDSRITTVSALLRRHGLDPVPMLDPAADGVAAARAIDAWLGRILPRRPMSPIAGDETPNPPERAFRESDRSGADIYYSLIADLALLEGEAIRRRDDRFRWQINDLRDFSDMPSHGRICLIKPGSADWDPTVLDIDQHLLGLFHRKMAPNGDTSGHWYGELLDGAVRRAFDPR